jgi:hypothetical protein
MPRSPHEAARLLCARCCSVRPSKDVWSTGEILVTERLYRDLREASRVNHRLAALDELVDDGILSNASASAVRRALGFHGKRPIELIEIRPTAPLRGGAFPGLSSRAIRDEYIDAGRAAALAALPKLA